MSSDSSSESEAYYSSPVHSVEVEGWGFNEDDAYCGFYVGFWSDVSRIISALIYSVDFLCANFVLYIAISMPIIPTTNRISTIIVYYLFCFLDSENIINQKGQSILC